MPKIKISKEELLALSWELIHRKGYTRTSIADISNAVGIGKAGVLHHFGSKERLMLEVVKWARENFRSYVLSVFAKAGNNKEGQPWTLELRIAEAIRRQYRLVRRDMSGCFFANSMLEVGANPTFREDLKGFFEDWLEALAKALSERFPAEEARERAYRLFTDYQGSVMLYKTTGDRNHLERYRARAVDSLSRPIYSLPD